MLLIFPPVAKPCEPPAGIALLSAALKENGIDCKCVDANVDGLLWLINSVGKDKATDSWTRRALKNRDSLLHDLRNQNLYTNVDRYHQRVYDLNHLAAVSVDRSRFRVSLSDYSDNQLSSVDSKALLDSAALYRENPFFPYFEEKLKPVIESWDHPWNRSLPLLPEPGPGHLCPGRVDQGQFCRQKTCHGRRPGLFVDEPP